jgi:MFS transporter, ACS family, glucarate transporter
VRHPWRWVGLLSGTAMASYLARVNLSVAGDPLMQDLGLTQPQMGRIFSAFLLGYALCQIPGGMLADRWGTRRVLAVSSASWVVATLGIALAGWGPLAGLGVVPALLIFRFLLGVGEAPTFPAAARGVARWIVPAYQGRANGVVLAAIGLGSALAPPLITFFMTRWGWRAAVVVSALPAVLTAVLWTLLRTPDESGDTAAGSAGERVVTTVPGSGESVAVSGLREAPSEGLETRGPRLRSRSFAMLTASYTLQGYVGYIFVFWFYLYLVQERHFTLLESAFLGSLPWLLSIVSIPLGGWLSDRLVAGPAGVVWGRRAVPLAGLISGGVMLSIGAATSSPYVAAVALALSTAAVLSVEGPFWATMLSVAGPKSGTAGGVMNMGSNIGGFISPALTPVLAVSIGWENALHVAAGLSVIAGLLWLGVRAEDDGPD